MAGQALDASQKRHATHGNLGQDVHLQDPHQTAAGGRGTHIEAGAVHLLGGHGLHEVLAVVQPHVAQRLLLLRHFVVLVLQVLQQLGEPGQLARAVQRIICGFLLGFSLDFEVFGLPMTCR